MDQNCFTDIKIAKQCRKLLAIMKTLGQLGRMEGGGKGKGKGEGKGEKRGGKEGETR